MTPSGPRIIESCLFGIHGCCDRVKRIERRKIGRIRCYCKKNASFRFLWREEGEVGVSGVYWPRRRRRRRSWIWIMNILARSVDPNILIQILGEAELWQTYGVSHLWRVYVYIYIYTPLVFRNRLERSVIYIWNITTVSTVIVILFRHATIPCLSFYARCVPFSIFFFR